MSHKYKIILPLLALGILAIAYWFNTFAREQIIALFALWLVVSLSLNFASKVRNTIFSLLLLGIVAAMLFGVENLGSAKLEQTLALFALFAIATVSLNIINGTLGILSLGHHGFMLIGGYTTALLTLPNAARERITSSSRSTMNDFTINLSMENGLQSFGISTITAANVIFIVATLFLLIGAGLLMASRKGQLSGFVPAVMGVISIILVLLLPKEGQLAWLNTPLTEQVHFVLAVLIGGLLAMLFGIIVGFPSLRLRGDYLAIVTLGFGEIIRYLASTTLLAPVTNGALGFTGVPSEFGKSIWWTFAFLTITLFVIAKLKYSSYGRAMEAIREDEIAAEAMGINLAYHKVLGFAIAAFFAGVAGGLWVSWLGGARLEHFLFSLTFYFLVAISLGGTGSITGVLLGTAIVIGVRQYGDPLEETYTMAQWLQFSGVLFIITAAGLVLYKAARRLPKFVNWWMFSSILSLILISPLFNFLHLQPVLNSFLAQVQNNLSHLGQFWTNLSPREIIISVALIPLVLLLLAAVFYKKSFRQFLTIIMPISFVGLIVAVHILAIDQLPSHFIYLPIWLAISPLLILIITPSKYFSKITAYLLTFCGVVMLAISAFSPTLLTTDFSRLDSSGFNNFAFFKNFSWLEDTFRGFGMRSIFLSVLLIVIMIFKPAGILGRQEFNWAWVFGERKDKPTKEEKAQDAWLANEKLNK